MSALKISDAVMTSAQEQHIRATGCCPRESCQPQEGTAPKMKSIGNAWEAEALECQRCGTVWLVSLVNTELSQRRE